MPFCMAALLQLMMEQVLKWCGHGAIDPAGEQAEPEVQQ
jgi:hypothetical protein